MPRTRLIMISYPRGTGQNIVDADILIPIIIRTDGWLPNPLICLMSQRQADTPIKHKSQIFQKGMPCWSHGLLCDLSNSREFLSEELASENSYSKFRLHLQVDVVNFRSHRAAPSKIKYLIHKVFQTWVTYWKWSSFVCGTLYNSIMRSTIEYACFEYRRKDMQPCARNLLFLFSEGQDWLIILSICFSVFSSVFLHRCKHISIGGRTIRRADNSSPDNSSPDNSSPDYSSHV